MKEPQCAELVERAVEEALLPREYLYIEDTRGRIRHLDALCDGAVKGGDLESFPDFSSWLEWLAWSTVVLDERDYLKAAVSALSLAPVLAGTDYGSSKQRDLGQLWTDAIRGFLGEIAFANWLKARFGVAAELDYSRGSLSEFLPSDIRSVDGRPPRLRVSIKTTKLRGIWLDVPFKQIEHSDVFVLVRVGVSRHHFLAFLKSISAIRDKLLSRGVELGVISS